MPPIASSAASATFCPTVYVGNSARSSSRRDSQTATRAATPVPARAIRRTRTSPPPPRATFSDRSLAAVVVRSSMTAITTIRAPGTYFTSIQVRTGVRTCRPGTRGLTPRIRAVAAGIATAPTTCCASTMRSPLCFSIRP